MHGRSGVEIRFFPSWLLSTLGIPVEIQRETDFILSSIIGLALPSLLISFPHLCLMRSFLHIPCPGCGVLHSIVSIQHLHFAQAWQSNPAGVVLTGMLCFQILARPIAILCVKTRPTINRLSTRGAIAVFASLMAVWIFRLFFGGFHSGIAFLS
jgi:hypothetical protein